MTGCCVPSPARGGAQQANLPTNHLPPALHQACSGVHDPAGDIRVLVQVVAGADPVVAVGHRQRNATAERPTYQQHGGQFLTLLTFFRSCATCGLSGGKIGSPLARFRSLAFL